MELSEKTLKGTLIDINQLRAKRPIPSTISTTILFNTDILILLRTKL